MPANALEPWRQFVPACGSVDQRAAAFLSATGCDFEAEHSASVVQVALRIAVQFSINPEQTETAAWLHDISAPIPPAERVELAETLGIDVLAEERAFPMIVHQRISAVMACELFGVDDPAVLSAIGCHTTLKPGASQLDMVVFVADKIAWDQPDEPPYLPDLLAALDESLEDASWAHLRYLWQRRTELPVLHPWAAAAFAELDAARRAQQGERAPRVQESGSGRRGV